jgi:hypothetical protein
MQNSSQITLGAAESRDPIFFAMTNMPILHTKPFHDKEVAAKFANYPPGVRTKLMQLRHLILETADDLAHVGPITETLKWGEPAYVTLESGSGSTIRIDWKAKSPNRYAMYFNCKTNLVDTFRTIFPTDFKFEGNRALTFNLSDSIPKDSLKYCVAAALTYHRKKASQAQ